MFVKIMLKQILAAGGLLAMLTSVSHAETISPRRLLEVADLSGPVVSPDGKHVAFRLEQASVTRNIHDVFWYVQAMDGQSPPYRIADAGVLLHDSAGSSMPGHAVWSPDGRWIYYRALVDGEMSVWRAAADGSGAEPVTHDPADVRDFILSADGRTLKYSVGATRAAVIAAERAEYDRGIHVDDTVPVGQGSLFHGGNINGRLETQRFRSGAMGWTRLPLLSGVPDRWKAIDLESGGMRSVASPDRPSPPLAGSGLPDGPWKRVTDPDTGRVALLTRIGDGKELMEKPDVQLSVRSGKHPSRITRCVAESCTGKAISSIQWRSHSDEVLFTVTDPRGGHAQSIYRWNVRTGEARLVAQSEGLLNGGRDYTSICGASTEALACITAEADRPPRLERIDLATGSRQVLFDPNKALAVDMAKKTPSRLLRWTNAKGQEFTGRLFAAHPSGHRPPPLFVSYYACRGFLRGGVGDEWPFASLAEHGISALCINSAPYRLDAVERYGLGLSAVESVIDFLASKGEIDRTRVGMGGLSFGSEVTLWTMTQSDLVAAASVTSPEMSRNYYLFGSMRGEAFSKELKQFWQLGALEETPERWRLLSPAANLDKIKAPLLMQMPEQEYVIALEYAIPLIQSHRGDLYVFPNEPHQKFQPRHKLAAYERNVDWFRFWLQGYEDPDPAKATQYAHWRGMKKALEKSPAPGTVEADPQAK